MRNFFSNNLDSIALETRHARYTFLDIELKAKELKSIYRKEIPVGQCVLVSSKNPFIFISTLLAFSDIDLVFCCWNGNTDIKKMAELVWAVGAIHTSTTDDSINIEHIQLDKKVNRQKGDFIITTSGSSGAPKGVSLDLNNVISNAVEAGKAIEFASYDLEKWCIDIDFSLMSAISHMFMAWTEGIAITHLGGFNDYEVSSLFELSKIGMGGAPLQLTRLAQNVNMFYPGSLLVSSGDFLTKTNVKNILSRHPDLSICTFYGLTELSGRYCYMNAKDVREHAGAAGHPMTGFNIRLSEQDRGEIIATSPFMFNGYYRENHVFEPMEGEFRTGDVGKIDADGFLWLEGRSNDTFKVSGEKVNRKVIEDVLSPLIGTSDYCILPVKHNTMGTCCALFVAKDKDLIAIKLRDIVTLIRASLPSNCVPVYSYLVDELPRLGNGKIDKQYLIKNHSSYQRYR